MSTRDELEPLPDGLADALATAEAHPWDPDARGAVEPLQTHISHVFLTRTRVYKLRKAVALGFLDFSTRAARRADCDREVALNRRLAPDVYLGVAPVERVGGRWQVGRPDPTAADPGAPECLVVMRRLAAGTDALSRLRRGELAAPHVDAIAEAVARFHDRVGLGVPAPFSADAWRAAITGPVEANFRSLAESGDVVSEALVERVRGAARAFAAARAERFERRRRAGRAVDGHGDLHLEHVWLESPDAPPIFIDCIEFDAGLRRVDGASDAAFLAMDLAYRERADLADRFLARYARERDDFDLYGVVDYFASYRAAVRAKVAALAARDAAVPEAQRRAATESARRHLDLADRSLVPVRPGPLVLVAGAVGSGKSTAAEVAAEALGGVVISSDRVRKRQAGLAPSERAGDGWQQGLYTPEVTEQVYAGLRERAASVLASGRAAVLDATHARRAHRDAARQRAGAAGAAALLVEVRCDPSVARARLAARSAADRDPSDAGPERLDASLAAFEAPAAEEDVLEVRTDREGWEEALRAGLRARLGDPT